MKKINFADYKSILSELQKLQLDFDKSYMTIMIYADPKVYRENSNDICESEWIISVTLYDKKEKKCIHYETFYIASYRTAEENEERFNKFKKTLEM